MKRITFFLVFACLIFSNYACQNKAENISIEEQIAALITPESQRLFLEEIKDVDQQVRIEEGLAIEKFGHNSPEHQEARQKWMAADEINFAKIEAYLTKYGHPTLALHGKKATETPWLVIHHGPDEAIRERNFKYFYGAWKNKDIEIGTLNFFMGRWHNIKYGHRIRWNGPFTAEEERDTFFKALAIEELILKP